MAYTMKRNQKSATKIDTTPRAIRNRILLAVVESGDITRFRTRNQRSKKSKDLGSRARRKAQQRREDW